MCILLIEGDSSKRESLAADLARAGYKTDAVRDLARGFDSANWSRHDVIVIDVAQPDGDWLALIRRIRDEGAEAGIILLAPGGSVDHRVKGLNSGADDCLPKPFAFEELVARIGALQRNTRRSKAPTIEIDDLVIDTYSRCVTRDGAPVALTAREFRLLEYLALNRGKTVPRFELEDDLYGVDNSPLSNAVASAICILRKKLGASGAKRNLVLTRRGGYCLAG